MTSKLNRVDGRQDFARRRTLKREIELSAFFFSRVMRGGVVERDRATEERSLRFLARHTNCRKGLALHPSTPTFSRELRITAGSSATSNKGWIY